MNGLNRRTTSNVLIVTMYGTTKTYQKISTEIFFRGSSCALKATPAPLGTPQPVVAEEVGRGSCNLEYTLGT